MIVAVVVGEVVYQRAWGPSLRLLAVAACAGLAGLETYLPGMLSSSVTWRGNERILNDDFLNVGWSESLNASLPSTVPAFTGWWGYVQPIPMVYIAWFLIPLLAFIDWAAVRLSWREFAGAALFALMFLMWTAGPGRIGPLRWPARVLPMLAVGLLVLVCVLLSRYGSFADWRRRGIAAAMLIGLLFVRSFSAAPHLVLRHLGAVAVVAVLTAALVWLARTRGVAAACVLAIAAMFPIAYYQVTAQAPTPLSYHFPERRSDVRAVFPHFDGVTLQLGDRALVPPAEQNLDRAWGSLAFGNYAKNLGLQYVNAYTPIGYRKFSKLLCMGWDGSTCPAAFGAAFSVEPSTERTYVDLMRVDRVVLQRSQYRDIGNHPAPPGWKWVDYPGHERDIWVLEREGGPISTSVGPADAQGVTFTQVGRDSVSSHLRVDSAEGGRLVFARLAWPGYRVTLDGRDIGFHTIANTFVAVDIPPGTRDGDLIVAWRSPGWKIGIATALAGLLGLGLLQWSHRRDSRRGGRIDADTAVDKLGPETEPSTTPVLV